ncbi:hypothetical protein [Nocardioides sp. GY 10127]|uniref:hypothetical protein n=1 Tax=Nocardioides sp. GY 10127 TaxID=2569762 RepID=UPI0010A8C8AB|nr:hypothetical protein [Nocardioides sp. GY 10127]TIC85588.1 hypothetical protein E8D37_02915 [Nocardioides sp. GY 10127]
MRHLLRAEADRLRWRRAVVLLVLGGVLLTAFTFAVTAWNTRPVSQAELDAVFSERYAASELAECQAHPRRYLSGAVIDDSTVDGTTSDGAGSDTLVEQRCRDLLSSWYGLRPTLDPQNSLENGVAGVSAVLVLLLLLVGTTFAGHDWSTGSMSNQLLYEPRRARVWGAKALVVTAAAMAVCAVLLGALWGGLLGLAALRDITVAPGVPGDGWAQVARTTLLAGLAALLGFALTMLFRSTVATIAVLFALALTSGGLFLTLGIFGTSGRWEPATNVAALVVGEADYYDESVLAPECFRPNGGLRWKRAGCDPYRTVGAVQGGLYVGTGVALVCVGSVLVHRRRDV